jgi:glutamate synthase (NADPH/NADH) large chain
LDKLTTSSLTEIDSEADTGRVAKNDLNHRLLKETYATLETGTPLHLTLPINPTDNAVGSQLAAAIVDHFGDEGLLEGTVNITFHGDAGSGFGAGTTSGMELTLIGEASDCVGQQMGGGQIVVRPSLKSQLEVSNGVMVGDFALEEAYGGNLFVAGQANDHFAFRNYGATAVVECVGDFCCAEMADGVVVVLGSVGKKFGAGMQGGSAFVLTADLPQNVFASEVHPAPVTENSDLELLKYLITRHVRLTGSVHARIILDDWSNQLKFVRKIRPNGVAPTVF